MTSASHDIVLHREPEATDWKTVALLRAPSAEDAIYVTADTNGSRIRSGTYAALPWEPMLKTIGFKMELTDVA